MTDLPTMGWMLDPEDRALLLERFPPAFEEVNRTQQRAIGPTSIC